MIANHHSTYQTTSVNTKDLVERSIKKDSKAQKMLFDRLSIPMMGVCLRYTRSREDAEEVLLEGFHKMFLALKKMNYISEKAFFGWVKKIMVNEALMHLRRKKEIRTLAINEDLDVEYDVSPIENLQTKDLLMIIQQIPIGYRTVFNLYEIEGIGHEEISEKLKISIGTSKSQLHKAKKMLKSILEEKSSGYGT